MRGLLAIGEDKPETVNRFLTSENNPLLEPQLTVIDTFGGSGSINKKALMEAMEINHFLSGCAAMQPGYDSPAISLTRFQLNPGESIVPKIEIGLRVFNPDRDALE